VERASKDYDEYADETITRGETCGMNRPSGKKITEIGLVRARARAHRKTLSVATARSICHREGKVRGVHARGAYFGGQVGANM